MYMSASCKLSSMVVDLLWCGLAASGTGNIAQVHRRADYHLNLNRLVKFRRFAKRNDPELNHSTGENLVIIFKKLKSKL